MPSPRSTNSEPTTQVDLSQSLNPVGTATASNHDLSTGMTSSPTIDSLAITIDDITTQIQDFKGKIESLEIKLRSIRALMDHCAVESLLSPLPEPPPRYGALSPPPPPISRQSLSSGGNPEFLYCVRPPPSGEGTRVPVTPLLCGPASNNTRRPGNGVSRWAYETGVEHSTFSSMRRDGA